MRVLSTKILTVLQKEQLLQDGISLVEYDAITVESITFQAPNSIKNAIITSKNAANAFIQKKVNADNCFCVGTKTAALLIDYGENVVKIAKNASDLGNYIAKNFRNESFYHFCGNLKREELASILTTNGIELNQIEVYKTTLANKKVDGNFDAILFFSPSAVTSYIKHHLLTNKIAFCIGETTAAEAKKFTQHISIANTPTIESVIAQVVKHKKNYA